MWGTGHRRCHREVVAWRCDFGEPIAGLAMSLAVGSEHRTMFYRLTWSQYGSLHDG
jgi:hypothetical protein